MEFALQDDEAKFVAEVRAFLAQEADGPDAADVMCPERESDSILADTPARKRFNKRLAKQGYVGLNWPVELGGKGAPGMYEYLLNEELARVGAPLIGKGVGCVGQTIIRHGSEKLKKEFLPKILSAEVEFALGYTEPHAGSDLANLRLKAERKDGGWLINGQKMFTTSAHFATWYWLAARTNFDGRKHEGITLFLVPMDDPGIKVTPIATLGDHVTNQVFLDNVWVSDDYVVGEPDNGWRYICEALDFERFTFYTFSPLEEKFKALVAQLKELERDGVKLSEIDHVRRGIARLGAEVETARMLQFRVVYAASRGGVPSIEAAMCKLYGTQLHQKLAAFAMDCLGPDGLLTKEVDEAPAGGKWEWSYRATVIDTIGAGTSEIQKNIIAKRELGLAI